LWTLTVSVIPIHYLQIALNNSGNNKSVYTQYITPDLVIPLASPEGTNAAWGTTGSSRGMSNHLPVTNGVHDRKQPMVVLEEYMQYMIYTGRRFLVVHI
jgi:hypothetical protein